MTRSTDLSSTTFPTLPDQAHQVAATDVIDSAQAAWWEIDHAPRSAWGTHIPFLFSLISLVRPRVFVELGVQRGASFFAACQAVEQLNLNMSCVAVDNWIGDPHAGESADGEFDSVRTRIDDNHSNFAGYIRGQFDDAAQQFESGSIDLLHIDGLHTAEAVTNDFECWHPKLSKRGIVLFHDINEYRGDFGAWRFWRSVRDRFDSFEFGHGHGLGVLFVGPESVNMLGETRTSLLSTEGREWLQVYFGGIGTASWELAQLRQQVADAHEVRQKLHAREREVEQLTLQRDRARDDIHKRPTPAELRDRGHKIRELETRLGETQKQLTTLDLVRRHDEELRARDRQLREQSAQIAQLLARDAAIQASASWRVTSPVRAVGRTLRRIRRT